MPRCRGCNAEIVFIKSPKSEKWIPCDFHKVRAAELPGSDLLVDDSGRIWTANGDGVPEQGRVPHWACPNANDFRRAI